MFKLFSCLLLIITTCIVMSSQAQQRNCGTMDVLERQLERSPDLAKKMKRIENFTQRIIQNSNGNYRNFDGIITIPVVVHVIYQTNAQNISEAQIQSQMQVLNDDFRRNNADADNTWPQAADIEIEFCLATTDPNGNTTTGITRKFSDRSEWGFSDDMKYASRGGVDAWPTGDYLNIWTCNIGGGILGYAQFPGGDASSDGVAMSPQYFGTVGSAQAPFDGGRTATHEVGHWLNLRHIWGDGNCNADDFVNDTPSSDAENYGCAIGHVSCNTTDMVQNYMDYSDDACMNLFTQGQKDRMLAQFESGGFRASLLNSNACGGSVASCNDGIQNQGETGVDCGGPCPACTSCNDGIQNQGETGVDCGGPCPACASCDDGIQNQGETGIDCGGPCIACDLNCSDTEVTVSITFDNFPEDISWIITNSTGITLASGGNYAGQTGGSTLTVTECLSNGCFDFIINDSYGDGLCCIEGNGSYMVTGGGNTLASGASFTFSETTNFCLGSPDPTCDDGIQNQGETGVDCGGPCTACDADCSDAEVTVSITFDNFPEDISWAITNSTGTTVASGNNYGNQTGGSTLTVTECLLNNCYDFIINDSYGDGLCCIEGYGSYMVTGGGNTLVSGASFTFSETTNFCLGSPDPTCNDGIQNQGETGVDCGGPCTACASCNDGIQNQDETGIDCGGPCTACASCNDGIQNQGETGIDCGGPCTACDADCSDTEVTVSITFDDFPEDISWAITNSTGSTMSSGDNYGDQAGGSTLTVTECLSNDCYDFIINDSYGDGLCCRNGNGSYLLTGGGNTFASGASFTLSETTNFCLDGLVATCNDGIQNQAETGVDCGGPCAACPTNSCDIPTNLSVELAEKTSNLNWSMVSAGVSYDVEIAEGGIAYKYNTATNSIVIQDFPAGTTYSFRVKTNCPTAASEWSDYYSFTTPNSGGDNPDGGSRNSQIEGENFESDLGYMRIYPNPAVNRVKIELNLISSATNVDLSIVDLTGKMVYTQPIQTNNQKQLVNINVESLSTGIYMIYVISDQHKLIKKLTVVE